MTGGRRSRLFGGSPSLLLVDENVPGIVLPDIAPEAMPALEQEDDEEQLLLAGSAEEEDIYAPQSEEEARYRDYVEGGGGLRLFIGNPNAGDIEERVRLPDDVDGPVWDVSSMAAPVADDDVDIYEHAAADVAEAQARFTPVLRGADIVSEPGDAPSPPAFQMNFGNDRSVEADAAEAADALGDGDPSGGERLAGDGLPAASQDPIDSDEVRRPSRQSSGLQVDGRLYEAVLDLGYGKPEVRQVADSRPIDASDIAFEALRRDTSGEPVDSEIEDGGHAPFADAYDDDDIEVDLDYEPSDDPATDDYETLPPFDSPDFDAEGDEHAGGSPRRLSGAPVVLRADPAPIGAQESDFGAFDERATDPGVLRSPGRRMLPWLALALIVVLVGVFLAWMVLRPPSHPEEGSPPAAASGTAGGQGAPTELEGEAPDASAAAWPVAVADGDSNTAPSAAEPTGRSLGRSPPTGAPGNQRQIAQPAPASSPPAPPSRSTQWTGSARAVPVRGAAEPAPPATAAASSRPSAMPSPPAAVDSRALERTPEVTVSEIPIGQLLIGTSLRVDEGQALLSLSSNVGATVYVDGREVGPTPIAGHAVSSGRHVVRAISQSSRKVTEVALVVDAGTARRVSFEF